MRSKLKPVTTTLTVSTQYISPGGANGMYLDKVESCSWTFTHPASATTTYTVQGSNMSEADILAGADDWFDYGGITIGEKTSTEKIGVGWTKFAYARARLKAVTTVASGSVTVRQCVKGPK